MSGKHTATAAGGTAAFDEEEEMYDNPKPQNTTYQVDYAELVRRSGSLGYPVPTKENKLSMNGGNGKGQRAAFISR